MLAEKASTSVIAIDERGHYTPVVFTFADECRLEPIRQPIPGLNCVPNPEGPMVEKFTDCFVEHAKAIRSQLQSPPPGKTYHLLVFVHGGLNLEQDRLERAFVDANRMLADQSAISSGTATGRLAADEIWYPLFITWPSGGFQSYFDHRVHYNQGDYGSDYKRISSPLYFLTDAVESVVRAPLAWIEFGDLVPARPRPRRRADRRPDRLRERRRDLPLRAAPRPRRPPDLPTRSGTGAPPASSAGWSPCRRSRSSASRPGTRWSAARAC